MSCVPGIVLVVRLVLIIYAFIEDGNLRARLPFLTLQDKKMITKGIVSLPDLLS
jgi:hypothetical protein